MMCRFIPNGTECLIEWRHMSHWIMSPSNNSYLTYVQCCQFRDVQNFYVAWLIHHFPCELPLSTSSRSLTTVHEKWCWCPTAQKRWTSQGWPHSMGSLGRWTYSVWHMPLLDHSFEVIINRHAYHLCSCLCNRVNNKKLPANSFALCIAMENRDSKMRLDCRVFHLERFFQPNRPKILKNIIQNRVLQRF